MTDNFYYSVRTRAALATDRSAVPLGAAHYSYGLVCQRLLSVLAADGEVPAEILYPEIYPSANHIGRHTGRQTSVHLIFKPFDEFRVLKGAYNIAVVFWEFERLPVLTLLPSDHEKRLDMFSDYVHCLGLVQEVWVGCEFTRAVLNSHGVGNVHVVPAPVGGRKDRSFQPHDESSTVEMVDCGRQSFRALGDGAGALRPLRSLSLRIETARQAGGRVLVCAINPFDSRKNPGAALLGFQMASGRRPADLLVVKLVADASVAMLGLITRDTLPARFAEHALGFGLLDCTSIILVSGHLPSADMQALWDAADFYLCASSAEGQNLPLLESMASGAVPISTCNTAMLDYLTPENAFIIAAHRTPLLERLAAAYGLVGVTWDVTRPCDVADAITAALTASAAERAEKSAAARRAVNVRYGPDCIARSVRHRLEHARSQQDNVARITAG